MNESLIDLNNPVCSPWNIGELKEAGLWESRQYISSPGLLPFVKELGDKIKGVEIGVASGWNMNYYLDALPGLNIIGIDPYLPFTDWNGELHTEELLNAQYEAALDNISSFEGRGNIIKARSDQLSDSFDEGQLDYIFIDGDHSYEAVLNDCNLYYSKVRSGGIFAGHDCELPAVKQALLDFRSGASLPNIRFAKDNVWFWIKE